MDTPQSYRYYVRSSDARTLYGFDIYEAAAVTAREYGEGTFVVDTMAQAYMPMLHQVRDGELVYAGFGGWDTGRFSLERDLIEAVKKGHVAIVQAFVAKGADVDGRDFKGAPALHWAVGGGKPEIIHVLLQAGADTKALDSHGLTASEVAQKRGREDLVEVLQKSQSG
jgi:Ankyrin repeats (3 copies)